MIYKNIKFKDNSRLYMINLNVIININKMFNIIKICRLKNELYDITMGIKVLLHNKINEI
jgi:uncharacterized protein YbaR (Trm112 family)